METATSHSPGRARSTDSELNRPLRSSVSLLHWGGILSGAAVGIAVLYVLQSFWSALAFGSDIAFFADNFGWWGFASSIVAALIAGIVAGYASGRRSPVAGAIAGLTVWGLILVAASRFDLGSAVQIIIGGTRGADQLGVESPLWARFASVAGGFVLTGIGGVFGGSLAPEDEVVDT